jgi:hypothetical protein
LKRVMCLPDSELCLLATLQDWAREDVVREGAGAVHACQGLVFAPDPAPGVQAGRRRLLPQCYRLDTAAMVAVWAAPAGAGRSAVVDTAPAIHGKRSRSPPGTGAGLCPSGLYPDLFLVSCLQ